MGHNLFSFSPRPDNSILLFFLFLVSYPMLFSLFSPNHVSCSFCPLHFSSHPIIKFSYLFLLCSFFLFFPHPNNEILCFLLLFLAFSLHPNIVFSLVPTHIFFHFLPTPIVFFFSTHPNIFSFLPT